jgi:hypothetical protein
MSPWRIIKFYLVKICPINTVSRFSLVTGEIDDVYVAGLQSRPKWAKASKIIYIILYAREFRQWELNKI